MKIAAGLLVFLLALAGCSGAPAEEAGGASAPAGEEGGAEGGAAGEGQRIRIALGDIEGVETLNLLIAIERLRERGVEVELIELADEDLANQAVVGGQADVGLGAPYAVIQEVDAPIRAFCQLQTLRFFAVVDRERYPDWQALDGQGFTVHSRGSGTEGMARLVEQTEGITFSEISYVPGAEVRATALLQGNVSATFLDIPNLNFVMTEEPDRFHELPLPEIPATDEALFGQVEWLQNNEAVVQALLEEIITVWRSINEDPSFVVGERERFGLLEDLPPELEEQLLPYYEQASQEGVFSVDCGGPEAAEADFDFYTVAGQLEGEPDQLQVEDFWYFDPLEPALEAVGGSAPSAAPSDAPTDG
jgi:NitT/TauT family transport system substrate-binding protein